MTIINKITASLSYLSSISERFGSSFYLFDPDVFEKNFNDLLGSFQNFYPKTKIAYSYKTNYLPCICKQANSLGAYAEVVSRFEYEIAIQSGINPEMIIFNGPLKTKDDLHEALLAGVIVNVDSPYEVSHIQEIALEYPDSILRVGIRCAFKSKALPPTRFGIDPYSRTFWQIVQQLRKTPNIFLLGLHCHFLPHERSPKSYRLL